ncbi:hypothetical protein ACF0H5_018289 [Mactra antiquata]
MLPVNFVTFPVENVFNSLNVSTLVNRSDDTDSSNLFNLYDVVEEVDPLINSDDSNSLPSHVDDVSILSTAT